MQSHPNFFGLPLLFCLLSSALLPQSSLSARNSSKPFNPHTTIHQLSVASEQVFEVSADGTRTYTTIQAALRDATNPDVKKVIRVYPGSYFLESEEQIQVTVEDTHIIGISKGSVAVHGNVQLGSLAGATINIKADNCSVENMTLTNMAKITDVENYKATALMVYIGSDGFRGKDLKLYSFTDPAVNRGWGYDCFWCHVNTTDCRLQNCEIFAYSDIVSVGGELTITDSVINVMIASGGYPFWVGQGTNYGRAYLTAVNVETRGCRWPFGYVVFGENGNADARLINVTETEKVATPPDYYIAATNAASSLLLSKTFGQVPRNPKSVTTAYLQHDVKEVPDGLPATKLANGAISNAEFLSLDGINGSIQSQLDTKAATAHAHDERYYTEQEVDTALAEKQPASKALTQLSEGINGFVYSHPWNGGSLEAREIEGSGNDIKVINGNGAFGNPVIAVGTNIPRFTDEGKWEKDQVFTGNVSVGRELSTQGRRVSERDINVGSHVLQQSDYILWLDPSAGDINVQLPPSNTTTPRGKIYKFIVISDGTGQISVQSPRGTPFRLDGTVIPGGSDLIIPPSAGTEITLVRSSTEWRAVQK